MKIYLAGSVPKGDKEAEGFDDWRVRYRETIKKFMDGAEFINPYHEALDEGDFMSVVGSDCKHILENDIVVVYAEDRLGVGTSTELVIAKYFKKPVITVLPKNTFHRRSNVVFHGKLVEDWVHPFIFTFSDFIIEDIGEIEGIKDKIFTTAIKDISIINQAIKYLESL